MAEPNAQMASMYKTNEPSGLEGALKRTAGQIGPSGPTASQVNSQPRRIVDQADFGMRGGVANSVFGVANNFRQNLEKQQEFDGKKKQFEELVSRQKEGADDFYKEAIEKTNGEAKNWVPLPELFVDQETGVFMPVKYYEAAWKGMQEYSKDQTAKEQAKVLADYRERGRDQGDTRIAQGQQRIDLDKDKFKNQKGYEQDKVAISNETNRIRRMAVGSRTAQQIQNEEDDVINSMSRHQDMLNKYRQTVKTLESEIKAAKTTGRPPNPRVGEYEPIKGDTAYIEEKQNDLSAANTTFENAKTLEKVLGDKLREIQQQKNRIGAIKPPKDTPEPPPDKSGKPIVPPGASAPPPATSGSGNIGRFKVIGVSVQPGTIPKVR